MIVSLVVEELFEMPGGPDANYFIDFLTGAALSMNGSYLRLLVLLELGHAIKELGLADGLPSGTKPHHLVLCNKAGDLLSGLMVHFLDELIIGLREVADVLGVV